MNLNTIAREITLAEGMKKSVSIAQVKEVMRLLLKMMKKMTLAEITTMLNKYK